MDRTYYNRFKALDFNIYEFDSYSEYIRKLAELYNLMDHYSYDFIAAEYCNYIKKKYINQIHDKKIQNSICELILSKDVCNMLFANEIIKQQLKL